MIEINNDWTSDVFNRKFIDNFTEKITEEYNSKFTIEISHICDKLHRHFVNTPDAIALHTDQGKSITYCELMNKINLLRFQFKQQVWNRGDRILVLLPLGIDFVLTVFALFSENLVPVLIDPRLKRNYWKHHLKAIQIKAIISNRRILKLRWIHWWMMQFPLFSTDKASHGCQQFYLDSLDIPFMPTNPNLNIKLSTDSNKDNPLLDHQFTLVPSLESDELLLTLTSGTTGKPKIVTRSFQTLKHQQSLSCQYLPFLKRDVHLSLYGVAVLQSLVHGSSTLFCQNQSPDHLVSLISKYKITRLSAPPGILDPLLEYLENQKIKFNHVECILTGGAPIPRWLCYKIMVLFPKAELYIVYGSTECEPISKKKVSMTSLADQNHGYNVGSIIKELTLYKKPFAHFQNKEIFEVHLKGPNCAHTNASGFLETGDLAYENELGELTLIGRKNDHLHFPFLGLLEEHLETLPFIRRIACIAKHKSRLDIYIEVHSKQNQTHDHTTIRNLIYNLIFDEPYHLKLIPIKLHFCKKIPVDTRHKWKIQRHLLY